MSEDEEQVLETNKSFYRAFEIRDINAMQDVWAKKDDVQCGHPGWRIVKGWEAVMESWRRIFENTPPIGFLLSDVSVQISGALAWVTLYENIHSTVEGRVVTATVLTTNIFEKRSDGWRMLHHHGSPVAEPASQADSTTVH